MNPETNKFEELLELTESQKEQKKQLEKAYGVLLRPNGEPVPKHWSVFMVGEEYVINEYTFRCAYIGETSILFEPCGIPIIDNK